MPNHLHLLIYFNNQDSSINTTLANSKRFLAYEIIKRLQDLGREDILTRQSQVVTEEERKRKKKHRIFQSSSDIKPCYTTKFLLQKLNYIHKNPVTGKWNLSQSLIDYVHSSARFYAENLQHPSVNMTHYMDVGNSIVPEAGDDT